jgi:tetratricopeptide (TPR) repeat protein
MLHTNRRIPEAEKAFGQAVRLLEKAVAQSPSSADYEDRLAASRNNLAVCLARQNRFREAEVVFRQERDFWAKRLQQDSSAPHIRSKLALSQSHLGAVLRDLGRPQDAEPVMREAVRMRRGLVEDYPQRLWWRFTLGDTLRKLAALVVTNHGDHAEARRLLDQAVTQTNTAVQLAPKVNEYRQALRNQYAALAESLLRLQEPGEAAKVAVEMPPLFPKDPAGYVDAGRLLARCAVLAEKVPDLPEAGRRRLAQSCADQAVPLLSEAIRLGYKAIDRLSASPQLDEATRLLLAQWVEKAKQKNSN